MKEKVDEATVSRQREELKEWLEELGLDEYYPRLVSKGYDSLDKIPSLSTAGLTYTINIFKAGHCLRIEKAAQQIVAWRASKAI